MKFDPKKPVQTRDGHKAKILKTDMKGNYPIVAVVEEVDGSEDVQTFSSGGIFNPDDNGAIMTTMDLINIPEKRWVLIYNMGGHATHSMVFESEKRITEWLEDKDYTRIACIPFTDGDGLGIEFKDCTFAEPQGLAIKVEP